MPFDGLILVPGLMCNHLLFAPQIAEFGDRFPIEVAEPVFDDSIEQMATRILNGTNFNRFALCGLSMGGIIAMEMLRQASGRVERLALMDTNHLPDADDRLEMRVRQIGRARNGELSSMMMEELKPFYVAPQHMGDPELNAVFMEMAETLGPRVFEAQATALMARQDATVVLSGYDGHTLVLCGEHDQPCPVSRHREIHTLLPTSHLVIVPDAGHITTLENPLAVNDALGDWLGYSTSLQT